MPTNIRESIVSILQSCRQFIAQGQWKQVRMLLIENTPILQHCTPQIFGDILQQIGKLLAVDNQLSLYRIRKCPTFAVVVAGGLPSVASR
jgi:hypothetical protein